jgi:hypothetical protein
MSRASAPPARIMAQPQIVTNPRPERMMRNHLTSLFLSFMYGSAIPDAYRLGLEAASAKWFRGVWISGTVVAVGCMAEIWEIAFDLRNWWRFKKDWEPLKENPGSWMYPLAAFGLFLVVGGIVGETVFEVLDSNVESQLRSHASDVISDAESRAADANDKAVGAEKHATALDNSTQQLKTDEATARREAESEKLKRAQIEASVAFRSLTDQQKKDIGSALGQFKSQAGASLWFPAEDIEAELFADDIAEALRSGGIIVQPPAGIVTMRGAGKFNDPIVRADAGVMVQSTKVGGSPQFALAVIDELNKCGFDARRQTTPPFDEHSSFPEIWINIEARPKGPQGEYKLQAVREAKEKAKSKIK